MRGSVVIPSRNGLELLRRHLPRLTGEAPGWEVIVVDDASSDGTCEAGPAEFPGVRFARREGPPGFCHSVNLGMSLAGGDILLLLNNDVSPRKGAVAELVQALESAPDSVYAAVPVITRPGMQDEGGMRTGFRRGLAVTGPEEHGVPYPSGACSLFRRSHWETLGGLAVEFAPIYWEDADLGVRAACAGLSMTRAPLSIWDHEHAATMGGGPASRRLRERNRFIFMERHCSTPFMRFRSAAWMPLHLLLSLSRGRTEFVTGWLDYLAWRRSRGKVGR
ncbi:glycosyltransferase [Candidatus Fermentibacteria bacterium]|nr:glycosyltransferase [Candidatus Fermentibacteria bacterium]